MINVHLIMDINKQLCLDINWINKTCEEILLNNGHKNADISFIITTDTKLSELKKMFFNKDVLTDVISFNLEENGKTIEGEVYISLQRVEENAIKFGEDLMSELKRVIIHGSLHLIGLNDKTTNEKKRMTNLENNYIK